MFQCQIAQFDRGVCFSEEADEARTDRNDPRRIGSGQNPEVDEPSLHTAPLSVPVSQKPTQRTMMNADCKASFICRSPWGVSWSYQIPRRLICYGPGVCVVGGASPDFARSRFFYFFFRRTGQHIDCTNPMQRYIASANALRARVATSVWRRRKTNEPWTDRRGPVKVTAIASLTRYRYPESVQRYLTLVAQHRGPQARITHIHQHSRRRTPNSVRAPKPSRVADQLRPSVPCA